jgi:hypothetical protein
MKMDDFDVKSLSFSRNEWTARVVNIYSPLVIEGYNSIFKKAFQMCEENNEKEKYLMTFQNLILRIPKWNQNIIENETKRILEKSNCPHLEELITCVHIIYLKALTLMRVGCKQKKIDINIPKLDVFTHKVYCMTSKKIYQNTYLFEKYISPLQIQKNKRELEIIVNECILNTIRENIPVDEILKKYLEETIEEEIVEKEIEPPEKPPVEEKKVVVAEEKKEDEKKGEELKVEEIKEVPVVEEIQKISFNDTDFVHDNNTNSITQIIAPKDIESLNKKNEERERQRLLEDDDDDNDDCDRIKISNEIVSVNDIDIKNINDMSTISEDELGVETLP